MRGPLGMLFWACLTAGFLTSSILGWLPWRWASLLLSSMALLLFGVMHFVPESPYFLIWKRIIDTEFNVTDKDCDPKDCFFVIQAET